MILEKFKKTVKKHRMLTGGEVIVTAVSGGADSMVLLHLLNRFVRENGGKVVAAHLNHGLRGDEADRDEEHVRNIAMKMDIPFISKRVDVKGISKESGLNIHDSARRERYRFFEDILKEVCGDRIALGHNEDDQAETVMMRIIRGAGMKGMGGIPPVRGKIIRPLIGLTREEIEAYAVSEGIEYVEDSSNSDKKYFRNRIRHELMPILKGYNPGIYRELNMLSTITRDADFYLADEARKAFESAACNVEEGMVSLDALKLNSLSPPIMGKVVLIALEKVAGDSQGFYSRHILNIVELVSEGRSGSSLDLPKRVKVCIEYDKVTFNVGNEKDPQPFSYTLNMLGETFIPEADVTLLSGDADRYDSRVKDCSDSICLDLEKIISPLEVRSFKEGDRIKLKGMTGRKKVKDFFIDEKIPRRVRVRIPLLVSGDEVLWIVGYRGGEKAVADSDTTKALHVAKV